MSDRNRHIIQRQILEVELPETAGTRPGELADELARLGRRVVPPLVEMALTRLAGEEGFRRVDQLTIELAVDELSGLEEALRRELPGLVQAALAADEKAQPAGGSPSARDTVGPSDWILTFLKEGYLPWSAPQKLTLSELRYQLANLLAASPELARRIHDLLRHHAPALPRFLHAFGPPGAQRLWEALAPTGAAHERERLFTTYLNFDQTPTETVLRAWRLVLAAPEAPPAQLLARLAQADASLSPLLAEDRESPAETAATPPLFVDQAGLVLLHPFLPRLLRTLKLADEDTLRHPATAAQLFHFICTGRVAEAEWELVMPKMLLGWPLEQDLAIVPLPEAHRREGEELLRAVIKHWTVLGNTSPAGLRESFLQREGKLQGREDQWLLQVEQRPYDMLLEQLPWGLQIIRLPWMKVPLYVEWM